MRKPLELLARSQPPQGSILPSRSPRSAPRRPACRWLAALLTALPVAAPGLPTAALASPVERDLTEAEAMATKAAAFFKAGLFDQAADTYLKAFALSGVPLMIYNAARAHEEAGKLQEARALFLHYVKLEVTADARAEAQGRIQALEQRLGANGTALPEPPPDRSNGSAGPVVGVEKPAEPSHFPVWQASGAAVLGAGAVGTYLLARKRADEANDLDVRTPADKEAYLDLADKARSWRGFAIGLAVGGGALAAWAVVEALSGPDEPGAAGAQAAGPLPGWSAVPVLGDDGGGFVVVGRF